MALADLVDFTYKNAVIQTKLPVIQSVGMVELEEIDFWDSLYKDKEYPRMLLHVSIKLSQRPQKLKPCGDEAIRRKV